MTHVTRHRWSGRSSRHLSCFGRAAICSRLGRRCLDLPIRSDRRITPLVICNRLRIFCRHDAFITAICNQISCHNGNVRRPITRHVQTDRVRSIRIHTLIWGVIGDSSILCCIFVGFVSVCSDFILCRLCCDSRFSCFASLCFCCLCHDRIKARAFAGIG